MQPTPVRLSLVRRSTSDARPPYVLVRLGAIDDRFPPLEDSVVFRDLLLNYGLAGVEGLFLLLQNERGSVPRMTMVKEGIARPGEAIDVSQFADTNLWLQINLERKLAGQLREFLYQPSDTRLYLARLTQSR
jgi:hypothetical protein